MNNSKNGHHKDKYFDTSRKILSQEMTMCNMEAVIFYFSKGMTNVNLYLKHYVDIKIFSTNRKILSQGLFM